MEITPTLLNQLMAEALAEAELAFASGEVPIGAVIADASGIIARAHNEVEELSTVVAHAEMLAIRRASESKKDWRLNDCVMCVTIEPCTMCIGATRLARIPTIVFGAREPNMGAVGSLYDLTHDPRLGALPRVVSGVFAEQCADLMKRFFASHRR